MTPDVLGAVGANLAVGAVALYTLVTGAQLTVERSLRLARHYDVPDEVLGMTVIALGTSLPELTAHVVASLGILSGTLDPTIAAAVVLGGNMGSSTTQQLLLLGLFVVAVGRVQFSDDLVAHTYVPMVLGFVLALVVAVDGTISRLDGLVLLAAFGAYAYYAYTRRARSFAPPDVASHAPRRDALVAVAGLVLVVLAASLLLATAETVVQGLALGGSTVGVVTLGVAAALPELSTTVDAVRRRAPNLVLGMLFGSNVVNTLVGIGLGGAISTYAVPSAVLLWDLPFKLAAALGVLGYVTLVGDGTLTRREGTWLLGLYFLYVVGRLLVFPGQ